MSILLVSLGGLCAPSLVSATLPQTAEGSSVGSPVRVAHAFIRALDKRQWRTACALMLPGTRRFISGRHSCPSSLRSSFEASYGEFTFSRNHWKSARIVKIDQLREGGNGAELTFRLSEKYRCTELRRRRPCRQRYSHYLRQEAMYLTHSPAGWRVAKVGAVLQDMELPAPQFAEVFLFPPATATSLQEPALLLPPPFACSGKPIAQAADPSGDVLGRRLRDVTDTPWLDATSLEVVQMTPEAVCVAIGLAATPHPDSEYTLFWHHRNNDPGRRPAVPNGQSVANRGAVAGWAEANVEIGIDGNGVAHPTINEVGALTQPSLAPYLPRFGFTEGKLEIELTPRQGFLMNQRWNLFATIDAEPTSLDSLLRHRLENRDRVPDNECVTYPAGGLEQEFFCQGGSV